MSLAKLFQLADIQYGFPFDSNCFGEKGRIRVVRIRDIKKPEKLTYFDGDYQDEYIIQNGDILVGMDGEFNCTIWNHGPALLNQRVAKIIPKKSVSKNYLYYLLKIKLKEIEKRTTFSTVKHLLDSHLRNLEMPLLPMESQIRVGLMLEKADKLKQKREQANQMANKILQSVFINMFGNPVLNPKKWKLLTLPQVGTLARGKSKHRPRNAPELLGGKYPLIQTGEVANNGGFITEYSQTYSEIGLKQSKMWSRGTLCITIAANIAATGILTFDSCFPDSIVGFTPNENVKTEYVQYWLSFLNLWAAPFGPVHRH